MSDTEMLPLFQLFEFSYSDGLLFYDRSGILSRRLQGLIPGLGFKNSSVDQRDFASPALELELLFGIGYSSIQSVLPAEADFSAMASGFLQTVAEVLEIGQLDRFHFRYVIGKLCASLIEAQHHLEPFLTPETKWTPFGPFTPEDPLQWKSVQTEFSLGDFAFELRTSALEVIPHESVRPLGAKPGEALPHIAFVWDVRGTAPIDLAAFDAKAFIENMRQKFTDGIAAKLSNLPTS